MDTARHLIAAYLDHQITRGLSPETVRRRRISLGLFQRYVTPCPIQTVTMPLVEEWLQSIPVATTRRAYRSDLAAFFQWASKRGLVTVNPVEDTDRITIPRGLPRPVDSHLVAWLIANAPDRDTEIAVALGAYAGLRRAEVAALTRDDIAVHASPPVLIVRNGKGGRDRVVPLHPELVRLLSNLPAGRVVRCKKATVGKKVAAYLRANGVNATLHQLRHTFGSEAARVSNGNVLVVRDLMGHASPTTTVRYTALAAAATATTVAGMYGGEAA